MTGCLCRYPMYIESDAWVTNLKQKLACGSILVSNHMEYYEWFTRGLQPGVHYVEVDADDICEDTLRKVLAHPFPCMVSAASPPYALATVIAFSSAHDAHAETTHLAASISSIVKWPAIISMSQPSPHRGQEASEVQDGH